MKLKKEFPRYSKKYNMFYCQICDKYAALWKTKEGIMICNSCRNRGKQNE